MLKSEKYKGFEIKVERDEYSESPREWDNLGTLICNHKRYDLGDKHNIPLNDFDSWNELKTYLEKENDIAMILPVYMIDHSGISISTEDFGCPWDSGQIGFIYITKEKIRSNFMVKKVTKKTLKQVKESLISEIKTYNSYLNNEVFFYDIIDKRGESIDSCSGCYDIDDILTQAKCIIDNKIMAA